VFRDPRSISCRDPANADDLWVVVATAKGGTVVAARTAVEMGRGCGLCVGYGHRPGGEWPPVVEYVPTFKSDVLLALANMREWPKYAAEHGGRVRCVVLTRHPLKKFTSLYTYALAGGEYGLQKLSKEMKVLHSTNVPQAVDHLFRSIGNKTLVDGLDYQQMSLARPDCIQIKYEDMEKDFDATMRLWTKQWGVKNPDVQQKVIALAGRHDLKKKSKEELAKEHHTSKKSISKAELAEVERIIMKHPELGGLINSHARTLGYTESSSQ
jgi:hypothetical protein